MNEIQIQLDRWGGYMRANRSEYLGYPRRNTIHRLMHEGTGAGQSTAPVERDTPEDIERIDLAVRHLPGGLRDAIELRYIRRLKIRQAAVELQTNRTEYMRRLEVAESRVSGFLHAITVTT